LIQEAMFWWWKRKKLEITDKPVKVYNFKVDNFIRIMLAKIGYGS